jgi:fluoride exporter
MRANPGGARLTSRLVARHGVAGAVVAGGALGATLRLALDAALPVEPGRWPWATFVANVVGTLALGYVATRLLERLPPALHLRPLLGTGACGALTTFSALQVEAITLGRDGHGALAVVYVVTSVAAGLAAVTLASALVRRARVAIP